MTLLIQTSDLQQQDSRKFTDAVNVLAAPFVRSDFRSQGAGKSGRTFLRSEGFSGPLRT